MSIRDGKKNKGARREEELKGLSLGKKTQYVFSYDPSCLETFDNKAVGEFSWVSLICPEFTSLCPKTGQPDFAKMIINYIPYKKMVESKSLKLYLFSFRNHGAFHEDCVQTICDDLVNLLEPKFLEVRGLFNPRGGISIYPYSSYSNKEEKFILLKEQRFSLYREENPEDVDELFGNDVFEDIDEDDINACLEDFDDE